MREKIIFILSYSFALMVRQGTPLLHQEIGRRDAISKAASAALVTTLKPSDAIASLDSFNESGGSRNFGLEHETQKVRTIISLENPPPILSFPMKSPSIPTTTGLYVPRIGYSFYKTTPDKAERCAALALRSGITHLDIATQYESNTEVGKTIQMYLRYGREILASDESPELLKLLDASYKYQTLRMDSKSKKRGRERRREELFLSHKISNQEQSTDPNNVRRTVLETMDTLGVDYLDMVSIHSPLTNSEMRLATYRALLDLQKEYDKTNSSPLIRSVGVCNYGLKPLMEIKAAGLPLPAVNQLELSPFNGHKEVVKWCDQNGVAVSCAAWSKLSGAKGPKDQWDKLAQLSDKKGITKAQALIRWSLQKGYICVPRSGCGTEIEKIAIAENSYGGGVVIKDGKLSKNSYVNEEQSAILTSEEMAILDGLDVNYKAGRLGRTDGWIEADIKGIKWDPTDV